MPRLKRRRPLRVRVWKTVRVISITGIEKWIVVSLASKFEIHPLMVSRPYAWREDLQAGTTTP